MPAERQHAVPARPAGQFHRNGAVVHPGVAQSLAPLPKRPTCHWFPLPAITHVSALYPYSRAQLHVFLGLSLARGTSSRAITRARCRAARRTAGNTGSIADPHTPGCQRSSFVPFPVSGTGLCPAYRPDAFISLPALAPAFHTAPALPVPAGQPSSL